MSEDTPVSTDALPEPQSGQTLAPVPESQQPTTLDTLDPPDAPPVPVPPPAPPAQTSVYEDKTTKELIEIIQVREAELKSARSSLFETSEKLADTQKLLKTSEAQKNQVSDQLTSLSMRIQTLTQGERTAVDKLNYADSCLRTMIDCFTDSVFRNASGAGRQFGELEQVLKTSGAASASQPAANKN